MTAEWYSLVPKARPHEWQWGRCRMWVNVQGGSVIVAVTRDKTEAHRVAEPAAAPLGETARHVCPEDALLRVTARTADRSMVARPRMPLTILGNTTTPMYVSSPVWAGLAAGDDAPFFEVPTHQPSGTWFGATPQAGVLAYACRTHARVDIDAVRPTPGRIFTRMLLVNPLPDPWPIERIEIPLPHLTLFRTDQALWTSGVRIERSPYDVVDVAIEPAPPVEAGVATELAGPRVPGTPRLSLQALAAWRWV